MRHLPCIAASACLVLAACSRTDYIQDADVQNDAVNAPIAIDEGDYPVNDSQCSHPDECGGGNED
jgi:hypothetical protein